MPFLTVTDWIEKVADRLFESMPGSLKLVFLSLLVIVVVYLLVRQFTLKARFKRLKLDLRDSKGKLADVTEDRDQLRKRIDSLDQIDEHVWKRPDAFANSCFVLRGSRPTGTRFIAVCNLKGGVGKTTTTVNVGMCLAQAGRRVLLIDLDFQGTMSNFLLPESVLAEHRAKGWTTDALLLPDAGPNLLHTHCFGVGDVRCCRVMIAKESLELTEFAQQARFFVEPRQEPRFRIQRVLHTPFAFHEYDYILFDCPPRMGTACVNALACSDYVLVPTTLSQLDIEAVSRTLNWLRQLRPVIPAEFLGVVLSRCKMRLGALTNFEKGQLDGLAKQIRLHEPGTNWVFEAMVPDSPEVHRYTAERKPIVLDKKSDAQRWYGDVCAELERRIPR